MKGLNALLLCDFYKVAHREQYPEGTEVVYSTWTPRSNKHAPQVDKVVAVGFQGFVKEYLIDFFNDEFFSKSKDEVVAEYARVLKFALGIAKPHTKHIEDLHDLGYLPIKIDALREGTLVPFRVPMLTIENTDDRFFWLTNYLETLASTTLWKPATSASIARKYKQLLDNFATETTGSTAGVEFQGHDFSMRGMSGLEDAARTGMGHLVAGFVGTDTIPSIMYAEQYYKANIETELVGCSVNATEHSVMCAGGADDEYETYRRLIEDTYPTGILSIVSDTWDLWHVLEDTIPKLKESILARDGGAESLDKVVIRPDSGDPADILCGDSNSDNPSAQKGVVQMLWDIFGGEVNDKGYKVLNPAIGAIYGDAITLERCEDICQRLKDNGFASTNVVFGIGSYTYQFTTRDTLGFAMKATSVTINGEQKAIFKDPVTDDGTKKSAVGRVRVLKNAFNNIAVIDETDVLYLGSSEECLLEPLFLNGKLLRDQSLNSIREMVDLG